MAGKIGLFLFNRNDPNRQEQLAELAAILAQLGVIIGAEPPDETQPTPHGHMPTEITDDGRIATEYGPVPMRVSDAIKASWPRALWSDSARVAYLEADRWNPRAERNTLDQAGGVCDVPIGYIRGVRIVSEDSVGLFQINVCAHPYTREQMLDPDLNAAAGYAVYRAQGWGAWRFSADTLGLL